MPEKTAACVLAQMRQMMGSLICALPICGLPASALAQSVPASLRACAAESDPGQRLDCYDREMAHLTPRSTPPPSASRAAKPDLPSSAAPPASTSSAMSSAASVAASAPAASAVAAPKPAAQESSAPPKVTAPWKIFSRGSSWRVTAHVAQLDRSPDAMVLHLDNGQVWRQIERASGDLSLRTGDSVTIEEHLGSYWLSSRYISNMKVRLEPKGSVQD